MAKEFTAKDKEEFLRLKEWCIKHPIEAAMRIQELTILAHELNNELFYERMKNASYNYEKEGENV